MSVNNEIRRKIANQLRELGISLTQRQQDLSERHYSAHKHPVLSIYERLPKKVTPKYVDPILYNFLESTFRSLVLETFPDINVYIIPSPLKNTKAKVFRSEHGYIVLLSEFHILHAEALASYGEMLLRAVEANKGRLPRPRNWLPYQFTKRSNGKTVWFPATSALIVQQVKHTARLAQRFNTLNDIDHVILKAGQEIVNLHSIRGNPHNSDRSHTESFLGSPEADNFVKGYLLPIITHELVHIRHDHFTWNDGGYAKRDFLVRQDDVLNSTLVELEADGWSVYLMHHFLCNAPFRNNDISIYTGAIFGFLTDYLLAGASHFQKKGRALSPFETWLCTRVGTTDMNLLHNVIEGHPTEIERLQLGMSHLLNLCATCGNRKQLSKVMHLISCMSCSFMDRYMRMIDSVPEQMLTTALNNPIIPINSQLEDRIARYSSCDEATRKAIHKLHRDGRDGFEKSIVNTPEALKSAMTRMAMK